MSGITRGKMLLGALAVAGLILYAGIVDLGVNAGRIHYGVRVDGVAVGGMTLDKAERVLARAARGLRAKRVTFHRRGTVFHLEPREVGWRPHPAASAAAAMDVGRSGGPLTAAGARLRAWTGIKLPWSGKPDHRRVTRLINEWTAKAEERGLKVDRARLRFQIRRAVRRMGKDRYRIPIQ